MTDEVGELGFEVLSTPLENIKHAREAVRSRTEYKPNFAMVAPHWTPMMCSGPPRVDTFEWTGSWFACSCMRIWTRASKDFWWTSAIWIDYPAPEAPIIWRHWPA